MNILSRVLVGLALVSLMFTGLSVNAQADIGDDEGPVDYSTIDGFVPTGPTWGGDTFALSDAVIKNNSGSNYTMTICHNWTTSTSGSTPHCSSGVGTLAPGQNSKSKYGWKDTDGILNVTNGRCLYSLSNKKVKTGSDDNKTNDFKVSGFYGATFNYRLDPCN